MLSLAITILHISLDTSIAESALVPICTADNSKFILLSENGSRNCIPCSVCPVGFQTERKCTTKSDTVCEKCPSGSYKDRTGSKCKTCSKCKKGEYIRQECNTTTNTLCNKCPNGTFSMFSNTRRCRPCRYCKLYEKITSDCTVKRDQQCGECYRDYFRDGSTGNCLPCSYCNTDRPYFMVEECFRKIGHSRHICLPTGYAAEHTDVILKKSEDDPNRFKNDSYLLTFIVLSVCVACALILFCCFIVVQLPNVQKYIRWCRDKAFYRTHVVKNKHEIDSCLNPSDVSRGHYDHNNDLRNLNGANTKTVTDTIDILSPVQESTTHKGKSAINETQIDMPKNEEPAETEASRLGTMLDTSEFEPKINDSISTHVSMTDSGIDDENDITVIDGIGESKTVLQTENKTNKTRPKKRKNKADNKGTTGTLFSNPKYFPIHAITTV